MTAADPKQSPKLVESSSMRRSDFLALSTFASILSGCGIDNSGSEEFSGDWIQRGGDKVCDGYMTPSEDDIYCVAEVPEDWRAFEFEGKTYYVQPLDDGTPR